MTDHLNTVRDIGKYDPQTGATTVVNHLVYDAFGRVTSEPEPPALAGGGLGSHFLFTAQPFAPDTALQNNVNRWYDPAVGRWLSDDPTGFDAEDTNHYRYVGNHAANSTDPIGDDWLKCMADRVEDNDPAKVAVPYPVKGPLSAFGAQDKTVVASVFRLIGQDELNSSTQKGKWSGGKGFRI